MFIYKKPAKQKPRWPSTVNYINIKTEYSVEEQFNILLHVVYFVIVFLLFHIKPNRSDITVQI